MRASESLQNDQLTATEKAPRRAVDTTPAFIHTGRPDGHLDYFNRGWLDLLGKSLDEVCGWRWTESIHPEDVDGIVQKWRAALASGDFQQVLDLTPQHIGVFGPDLYANHVALEYFGIDMDQWRGKYRIDFVPPDDRDRFLAGSSKAQSYRELRVGC